MKRRPGRITLGYAAVLATALAIAVCAGWTPLATSVDGSAYDWMFRLHPPPAAAKVQVAVLAIDELALQQIGGMRNVRGEIADALHRIRPLVPKAVVLDLILSDSAGSDQDERLESAIAATPNIVLSSDLLPEGSGWEKPLPQFARHAAAVGHVHAAPDPVSRVLPLEKAVRGGERKWAVALEALRLASGAAFIEESPKDLRVGSQTIPAARRDARSIRINYRADGVPIIGIGELDRRAEELRGMAVFVGVTALTAARDRLHTPFDRTMSGVEIHAHAYDTLANRRFLLDVSPSAMLGLCAIIVCAAGATFAYLSGWPAYLMGMLLVASAHLIPHFAFRNGFVMPYLSPVLAAWLSVVSAAAWQYFVVRRQLRRSEADKARYQQAIHFVTHEMRSPLTAIQGSSEMMGRYNLTEEKRKQMAQMINSESKRLARMIQTFLDIERLTDGNAEFRSEVFEVRAVIATCLDRARPLAERKEITLTVDKVDPALIKGDRELMEYAVYNLLTNAVKYSPEGTVTTVRAVQDSHGLRISVADQGIGMDEKELRNIFRKFYRTRKAEASGEVGTGIGLSIVEQIVAHHGGRMEVTSTPGKGSCFTMVLPCGAAVGAVSATVLAPES